MDLQKSLSPNAWATIYGYEDVTVALADGSPLVVRVRQIRVRQVPFLMGIIEDDFASMEYVCVGATEALPEGWIDLISAKSHRELVKKVRSVNFSVILDELEAKVEGAEEIFKAAPFTERANALKSSLTSVPSSSDAPTTKS